MTLALSSSKCFDRVSLAVQAVNKGKAPEAAAILRSVRNDAKLMQNELRKYHRKLQRFERGYMNKAEHLTGRINSLYQQEQTLLRQGRELEERIQQHHSQNERHVESRNEAERRYTEASEEEQKARHRREHLEKFYWVPIFNIAAALIEAYEQNGARASEAKAYMERHQQHMNEVNDDITYTNSRIRIIQSEINKVQIEVQSLNQQRDSCHDELGAVKSIVVFILDASTVLREILNLTEQATVKSEDLERIMHIAAKKNTLKILKSGGIQTKVGSFQECFDEIANMMQSARFIRFEEDSIAWNDLVYLLITIVCVLFVLNYVVLKVKQCLK